jgi:hypothetical protein
MATWVRRTGIRSRLGHRVKRSALAVLDLADTCVFGALRDGLPGSSRRRFATLIAEAARGDGEWTVAVGRGTPWMPDEVATELPGVIRRALDQVLGGTGRLPRAMRGSGFLLDVHDWWVAARPPHLVVELTFTPEQLSNQLKITCLVKLGSSAEPVATVEEVCWMS